MNPKPRQISRGFLGALLMSVCTLALAQWQWRDEQGQLHWSDRPPPAGVSPAQILKRPPGMPLPTPLPRYGRGESLDRATESASTNPPRETSSIQDKKPETATQRWAALQENKQKFAQAQQEKEASARRQARITEDCAKLQRWINTLESGVKIESTGSNGEREIYDDARRQGEIARARSDQKERCTAPSGSATSTKPKQDDLAKKTP